MPFLASLRSSLARAGILACGLLPSAAAGAKQPTPVYGYKIVTAHPVFGEVTSVLSFRNSSNGYYGGWMDRTGDVRTEGLQRITEDFTGD